MKIELLNLWLYPVIYGLVSLILLLVVSKGKTKRVLTFPKSKSKRFDKGMIGFITGKLLIVITLFIKIPFIDTSFYIGSFIYLVGMSLSVYSMWFFMGSELTQPVTRNIYKYSRHPMQVMNYVMWIGIIAVSRNWLLVVLLFLYIVLSRTSLVAQEKFCLEKYGDPYRFYMNRTPRYLIFK